MNQESLTELYDALEKAECVCEMNKVLTPLTDDELETAYEDFKVQYGEELAQGALERSE